MLLVLRCAAHSVRVIHLGLHARGLGLPCSALGAVMGAVSGIGRFVGNLCAAEVPALG